MKCIHTHTHTYIYTLPQHTCNHTHTHTIAGYNGIEEKQLNFCLLLHMYVLSSHCVCPLLCPVSRPCGIFVKNCIIHTYSKSWKREGVVGGTDRVSCRQRRHGLSSSSSSSCRAGRHACTWLAAPHIFHLKFTS